MKFYSQAWAENIVLKWTKSDPRVLLMISRFSEYAALYRIRDPEIWVRSRIVWALQSASQTHLWPILKAGVGDESLWRSLFNSVILTREAVENYEKSLQLPLNI